MYKGVGVRFAGYLKTGWGGGGEWGGGGLKRTPSGSATGLNYILLYLDLYVLGDDALIS